MTPFERYQAFVKTYPEAKETFKTMQAWYVANKPKNGIFVPSGNLYTMSPMLMKLVASKSKLAQSTPNHDFIATQQNAKQDYDLTNKLLSKILTSF